MRTFQVQPGRSAVTEQPLMQLLSSASAAIQKSDIGSRQRQQTHLRSASAFHRPCTTARHNLATSFTRALSEPNPIATQQLNAIARA
jgi:hypothetical protein